MAAKTKKPRRKTTTNRANQKRTSLKADKRTSSNELWEQNYQQLDKKYKRLLKEKTLEESLVKLATKLAPESYDLPEQYVNPSRRKRAKSSPQSAVLLLSDTHVGKKVELKQTLNNGIYNFEVFLDRLKRLEHSVISILDDHTTMEIDALNLFVLGDMIDGALNHANEADQQMTLFTQFYGAAHALAQFVRNLSAHVPRIQVRTAVGNHSRWQNQRKMPSTNRYSNLDQFLYVYMQSLLRDITNIEWELNIQPFCEVTIQGWNFLGAHGDHIRGGDKALGIPNHSIGRHVSSMAQLFSKQRKQVPHYYVMGHLHRSITLPHAHGEFLINGGFPGVDNFGLMEGFTPVDPCQRFFFVHPKFGKTASYDINVKVTDPRIKGQRPYYIPENLGI